MQSMIGKKKEGEGENKKSYIGMMDTLRIETKENRDKGNDNNEKTLQL